MSRVVNSRKINRTRQARRHWMGLIILYFFLIFGLSSAFAPGWIILTETGWFLGFIAEPMTLGGVRHRVNRICNRIRWMSSLVIAPIGTFSIAWGLVIGALANASDLSRYPGLSLGLVVAGSVGFVISAVIQGVMAVGEFMGDRHSSIPSSSIIPWAQTDGVSQTDRFLMRANRYLWLMLWNTVRGLGLSLLLVFAAVVGRGWGIAIATIWTVIFIKLVSLISYPVKKIGVSIPELETALPDCL